MNIDLNNGKVFCTKCGAANKSGYRFCVKCGAKLMIPVAKPQPYDAQETTVIDWAQPTEAPEQSAAPTFNAFEQASPAEEPVRAEPEPAKAEIEPEPPVFNAFEQVSPAEEPVKAEPEPAKVEIEPEPQTLGAFEQTASVEEPARTEEFAGNSQAAFEAEPEKPVAVFAHSEFSGTTTPTAAAGAFATAVEAVKNNKQIDVSDAETVMSLLEQGESSALAKGLPAWDIVPPQVVVRRKHRV